ncbi:MAG: hypothetical protein ACRYFZ_03460 [Janthinobacterium lividum]
MKTLLVMLIAGGGLLACKKDDATDKIAGTIGQPFDLTETQTTTLPVSGGSALSVSLTKVLDSRCPITLQCITAGYAAVDVQLSDATTAPQTAHLSLGTSGVPGYTRDSVSVTLSLQKYWLRLLDVKPYPNGNSGQIKTATLRLRPY